MSSIDSIVLREVKSSDLDAFFAHQLDPEAIRLAAFVYRDPKDRAAFDVHWAKILSSPLNMNRTIVAEGVVAGYVACFPQGDHLEVTYWLGREFWRKGVATQALHLLLNGVAARPIFGRVATDNIGSFRVLQKCGFEVVGQDKGFANGRGEETGEYIFRLGLDPVGEK